MPFLLTYGLAEIQIRMQYHLVGLMMLIAGLPERYIALNCRKEPFGRYEMELEASMFMVVASCWILMTNWPFFSR
jgi:hypothetical protein